MRKKKVSKSINIIFCHEKIIILAVLERIIVEFTAFMNDYLVFTHNIPIVLHLGILFMIRLYLIALFFSGPESLRNELHNNNVLK